MEEIASTNISLSLLSSLLGLDPDLGQKRERLLALGPKSELVKNPGKVLRKVGPAQGTDQSHGKQRRVALPRFHRAHKEGILAQPSDHSELMLDVSIRNRPVSTFKKMLLEWRAAWSNKSQLSPMDLGRRLEA